MIMVEETKTEAFWRGIIIGIVLSAVTAVLVIIVTLFMNGAAKSHDLVGWDGPHGQDPWYQAQLIPNGPAKGQSCCSTADGVTAEEDIRDGHYWTRFTDNTGIRHDWMRVPDEAILPTNHNGAPVVWYGIYDGVVLIRCFARGSGI